MQLLSQFFQKFTSNGFQTYFYYHNLSPESQQLSDGLNADFFWFCALVNIIKIPTGNWEAIKKTLEAIMKSDFNKVL